MEIDTKLLYVLELVEKKYYVGITRNLEWRIAQHKEGKGSTWTKMYPVVNLFSVELPYSNYHEDAKVKELMGVFGIDNVRGGRYSKIILTQGETDLIKSEIEHAEGKCFSCGEVGHLSVDCKNIIREKISCCKRCHRDTHDAKNCYARVTIECEKLCTGVNKNGLFCSRTIDNKYEYCYYHKK